MEFQAYSLQSRVLPKQWFGREDHSNSEENTTKMQIRQIRSPSPLRTTANSCSSLLLNEAKSSDLNSNSQVNRREIQSTCLWFTATKCWTNCTISSWKRMGQTRTSDKSSSNTTFICHQNRQGTLSQRGEEDEPTNNTDESTNNTDDQVVWNETQTPDLYQTRSGRTVRRAAQFQ